MNERPTPRKTREFDVNLLPESYRRRRVTRRRLFVAGAILVAVGLVVLLYLLVSSVISQNENLQADLDALEDQINAKQDQLDYVTDLQDETVAYKSVTSDQGTFTTELQTVYTNAGAAGITLETVALEGEKITIAASAADTDAAEDYVEALDQVYSLVTIFYTGWGTPVPFSIIITP